MIVECTTHQRDGRSFQVSVGETYLVVEVILQLSATEISRRMMYRLAADDNGAAGIYDADLFITIDGQVPSRWALSQIDPTAYVIGPRAWSESGFWERYFDDAAAAVDAVSEEIRLMIEESATPPTVTG